MIHSGVRRSLSFGYGPPGARRGFLPLVLAALGATRAIVGAVQANQAKQRNKGFINQNYRMSRSRLSTEQAATSENRDESLAARGLLQGGSGSAISTAMRDGIPKATSTPTDLASQDRTHTAEQFGLENTELDLQHSQAQQENRANYNNSLIASAMSGVSTALDVGNAAGEAGAGRTPSVPAGTVNSMGTPTPATPARNPANYAFGVNPTEPLAPQSRWSITGQRQPNYDFNVG